MAPPGVLVAQPGALVVQPGTLVARPGTLQTQLKALKLGGSIWQITGSGRLGGYTGNLIVQRKALEAQPKTSEA